jgi:hypothetical protein
MAVFTIMMAAMAAQAAQAPAADQNQNDPVACHTPQYDLGSHIKAKPVCMHKSEWEFIEKKAHRDMQSIQDRQIDPGRQQVPR